MPHPQQVVFACAASRHSTKFPNTFLRHRISRIAVGRPIYYLVPYILRHESCQRALLTRFIAQLAMSLVAPDSVFTPLDQLSPSALRRLHRRSSCPSIPRSVSIYSGVFGFDPSSEDPSHPGARGDWDIYMSPLFRGVEGSGEVDTEDAEGTSDTPTEGSTPRTRTILCDDRSFESLSDYNFDITGHELAPQSPKASKRDHGEQSLMPVHFDSPSVRNKTSSLDSEASQPLPPPRSLTPSLDDFPPVPPLKIKHLLPPNAGTRPLQIDRSKTRLKSSRTPQPLPAADVQHKPRPVKSILRTTTTQVDLRGAYRRAGPSAERKVHAREVMPIVPSPLRAQPKGPSPNDTEVMNDYHIDDTQRVNLPALQHVPVATLFSTGLIPLERAQDKFKHAHCLERLPPPPGPSDSSTSSQGDHSQRIRGWSLSRAFKRQKA